MRSSVSLCGGVPTLYVNGRPFYEAGYLTYLSERGDYAAFAAAGFRLFALPVFFGGAPINPVSGIRPLAPGIFDGELPDYSETEAALDRILAARPDALIMLRVNLSPPPAWLDAHPGEVNCLSDGSVCGVSFSSALWREWACERLREFWAHLSASPYGGHIVGLHLCAGQTEEFFHFGSPEGGFGPAAERGFAEYAARLRPDLGVTGIPAMSHPKLYKKNDLCFDETEILFCRYTSDVIADSILAFARAAKEATRGRIAVGCFYGYSLELTDPLCGHCALGRLLDSPDIDFLSSPASYATGRRAGTDWNPMLPLGSARLHGKLFFYEFDTRTHLSRPLSRCRPGACPPGAYEGGVWDGPPDPIASRRLLLSNFSRAMMDGSMIWWFDMWGGWFSDGETLGRLSEYNALMRASLSDSRRARRADIAVITDERSLAHINRDTPLAREWVTASLTPLSLVGAPFELFDIADLPAIAGHYRLYVFLATLLDTAAVEHAIKDSLAAGCHFLFTYKPFAATGTSGELFSPAVATARKLPCRSPCCASAPLWPACTSTPKGAISFTPTTAMSRCSAPQRAAKGLRSPRSAP